MEKVDNGIIERESVMNSLCGNVSDICHTGTFMRNLKRNLDVYRNYNISWELHDAGVFNDAELFRDTFMDIIGRRCRFSPDDRTFIYLVTMKAYRETLVEMITEIHPEFKESISIICEDFKYVRLQEGGKRGHLEIYRR